MHSKLSYEGCRPDLDRVDPGFSAPNAFHCGDGGSVKLAEWKQAGVDRVMTDLTVKVSKLSSGHTSALNYQTC